MNQKILHVFFGLVIVLLVGGFMYFKPEKQVELAIQQPSPSPLQPTITPKPTVVSTNPTAKWKTYVNTHYGIEFQYPHNWVLDSSEGNILDIHITNYQVVDRADCTKFVGMEIQAFHPIEGSFATFVKSQAGAEEGMGPRGNLTPITVDGHMGYSVENSGWYSGCDGPGYFIQANDSNYIYIFSGRGKAADQKIIDQILSTLKFTK